MDDASNILAEATKRLGTTLRGKYTLDKLLGLGGMAAVYRAVHRNGHRVAVKILHTSVGASPDIRMRFLREGYVANTVDHPGSVRVTDDDTADDGSVFLVMELLDGETVDALSERSGRLSARDVAMIAWQLLDVLAAAHAKGIVHRDIKPDNVFITQAGVLKVLDFGIARLVDSFTGAAATQTGRMVGTPAFMAPEQALGQNREIDARTDLWSVGATMFTLGSGQFVHDADTIAAMVVYAGSRKARAMSDAAADFPPPLAAVIDRALAFDKASRFSSAKEMQRAIGEAFETCFGTAVPQGALVLAAPPPPVSMPERDALAPTMSSDPIRFEATPSRDILPKASTTAGVSSERPQGRRRVPAAVLVAGGALVAIGGAVLFAALSRPPSLDPGAQAQPSSRSMVSVWAPPSVGIASVATPAATTAPVDSPVISASAASRPTHVVTARPTASASASPPPSNTAVAPAHADCEPPYTIDAQGHRVPKPGCY